MVEEVLEFGRPYSFGLEAGSKPELMAVMALADNETPIICNGFKDDEYIEMAMLAHKLGRKIIPVVEKYTELHLIVHYAKKVGVRPTMGIRVKLASRGSGRWKGSGGYRSKFGLTVTEAVQALDELKALGMADCLNLLHFHLGSQITNIRQVKGAVNEAARVYVELARSAPDSSSWTSAAASASTTTARRPISNRASTIRCRSTPTTSSTTSRTSATRRRSRIPPSSPRAAAPSPPITACWCSTCSASPGFTEDDKAPPLPPEPEQPLIDLQETFRAL